MIGQVEDKKILKAFSFAIVEIKKNGNKFNEHTLGDREVWPP